MAESAVVFGGAGFIGTHLLASLAQSGRYERVVSADIREPPRRTPGVTYRSCDIREPIPPELCPGATEIYNVAAVHRTPGHEDWEYFFTNVQGATQICRFASAAGVERLFFTSSVAVYGPSESQKDEDSVLEPESAYGKSKLCAEEIHRSWQAERPDRRQLVIIRPAAVYGHLEGGNFTRLARTLKRNLFFYPGRKDTIKACGYVEDLIASMRFMRDRSEPVLTYNFAHARPYSTEEICDAFSQVGGFPTARGTVPLPLMLSAAMAFEMLGRVGLKTPLNRARVMKLTRSTYIEPKRLIEAAFPYRYDLVAALAHWKETSPSGDFV